MPQEKNARLNEIDLIKGIGVMLVVFGHAMSYTTVTHVGETFPGREILWTFVYSFHMPLFFALSGFTFSRYLDAPLFSRQRWEQLARRSLRLLVPYFFCGLLYVPAKLVLAKYARAQVDMSFLRQMLLGQNPYGGLWFLYVLFFISALCLLLVDRRTLTLALALSALLFFRPLTPWNDSFAYLQHRMTQFLVCFLSGAFVYRIYPAMSRWRERRPLPAGLALAAAFALWGFLFWLVASGRKSGLWSVWMTWTAVGTLFYLAVFFKSISPDAFLVRCGRQCMDIYILHGPVQVAVRILLWQLLGLPYYVCVIGKFVVGLWGSWIISRAVVRRIPLLRTLLLGEPYRKDG